MKKILVSDLSLRCPAGQNAAPLTFRDKVNLASALDTLGLDVIELPALTGQKEDGVVLSTLCGAAERAAAAIPAPGLFLHPRGKAPASAGDPARIDRADGVSVSFQGAQNAGEDRLPGQGLRGAL